MLNISHRVCNGFMIGVLACEGFALAVLGFYSALPYALQGQITLMESTAAILGIGTLCFAGWALKKECEAATAAAIA